MMQGKAMFVRGRRGKELTLDDQVRTQDTHGSDTNTGLGRAVRGTQAGEHDGGRAAHGAEEGLYPDTTC